MEPWSCNSWIVLFIWVIGLGGNPSNNWKFLLLDAFSTNLTTSLNGWHKLNSSLTVSPLNNLILTLQVGLLLSTFEATFLFTFNPLVSTFPKDCPDPVKASNFFSGTGST